MRPIRNELARAGMAVALGIVAGCSNGSNDMTQSGKGAVQIVMSSSAATLAAPGGASGHGGTDGDGGGQIQAANVTFSSILARNLDGQLIDVTIALPATIDVIGLATNGAVTLPAGFLPPGTYDQIVIVISNVELTLTDGTVVPIDPPGGGFTAIIPVAAPFEVVDGVETIVNIQFQPDRSFRFRNGAWEFNPNFDCTGHHGGHDSH